MDQKNEQQSASFFHELGSFMKPYSGKYTLSVLISVLSVAAGIVSYALIGILSGMLFSEHPVIRTVFALAIGAACCKILHTVLLNVSTWISHHAAYQTLMDIRNALADKMMRLPMGYFEENGSGRLKTLLVDRIESMEKTLAHMIPELTANILGPIVCCIWMFFIDWRLALCAVIWIFIGLSVTFGMMNGYEKKYAGQIAAMKSMNQAVTEFVSGIEVIKNFGQADACYQKYTDAVYGHAAYNVNWQKETQGYSALGMAIAPFSLFPVLIAGLIFYSQNTLLPETLVLILLLTLGIFGPLMNSMTYFDQLAGMGTYAKEIKSVLTVQELQRGTAAASDYSQISFEHVNFSYIKDKTPVLKDISFDIPENTMFALVGPSGSGKSTIAKLIAGFWDADSGSITIGQQPISTYSQEELNRMIAYVDQDTFLFDRSILDNIRIADPNASEEAVIETAKRAGCDAFIRALPNGYHTMAGTAGNSLSGGERQRIAIVRAMMKQAPILILDEATASADPENEASIQEALSAAAKEKTLIVVAHRLLTIQHAEQIAFVRDGRIEAIGTHEELLKNCSAYADMWTLAEGT